MFSDPVIGSDFYGREDILETLRKRVGAFKNGYRQNVALIGHRELGKTSILHHFLYSHEDPGLLPIYVEVKPQAVEHFIDQFIRSLLFQFLRRNTAVDQTESLSVMAHSAQRHIPKTCGLIRDIIEKLKKSDKGAAYAASFELTTSLYLETGLKCVVILDEFHRLEDYAVKNAFQNFGKCIMFQKDTLYIISSSSFTASKRILAEKLSLLFGNFERIYLKPFTFEVSSRFIETKLEPVKTDENLRKFLIAFTDGHPFFLNVITRELKELSLNYGQTTLTKEVLIEALRRLFFAAEGVLNQYFLSWIAPWTQVTARGSQLSLLVGLASGKNKLNPLAEWIERSSPKTATQIKELINDELIVKNGSFFHFHNRSFMFWLKCVYRVKELSLLVHMRQKMEEFNRVCREEIDAYLEEAEASMCERIMKLMGSFQNEMVDFDSRGRKLPHFSEFREIEVKSGQAFVAKGGGIQWHCRVAKEKVAEKDILDFIEDGHQFKSLRLRRILFSTGGLEPNAKLLAKNQNIWTLNLKKINMLMDFYGKSKIVELASV